MEKVEVCNVRRERESTQAGRAGCRVDLVEGMGLVIVVVVVRS